MATEMFQTTSQNVTSIKTLKALWSDVLHTSLNTDKEEHGDVSGHQW